MRQVSNKDITQHFLGAELLPSGVKFTPTAPKSIPKDKIQEARIALWSALRYVGQAKHENVGSSPVVDTHLKDADEQIRIALRLIL